MKREHAEWTRWRGAVLAAVLTALLLAVPRPDLAEGRTTTEPALTTVGPRSTPYLTISSMPATIEAGRYDMRTCDECWEIDEEEFEVHSFSDIEPGENRWCENASPPEDETCHPGGYDGLCSRHHQLCGCGGVCEEQVEELVNAFDENDFAEMQRLYIASKDLLTWNSPRRVLQLLSCSGAVRLQLPVPIAVAGQFDQIAAVGNVSGNAMQRLR